MPRKNVRPLAGRPMVLWAVEAAVGARSLSRVVVSSDDEEVLRLAATVDARLALRRPAEMATDSAPAIEYIRHALQTLEQEGEERFDIVVVVQPSSPFTLPEDIDGTVKLLLETGAASAVSVVRVPHDLHPLKFKLMRESRLHPYIEDEAGRFSYHQMPDVYVRNCSVYAALREQIAVGEIIGDDCAGYVMPRERSIDINDELDMEFACFLAGRMKDRRGTKSRSAGYR